jgi:uncharacterized membrane protein YecN with MAPEG domain
VLGRGLHAFGMSRETEDFRLRISGMALTFATLACAALTLLWRMFA